MMPLSIRLAPARFLDPLLLAIVVLGTALYLAFRDAPAPSVRGRRGRWVAVAAWAGLWIFSTPAVANVLTRWTEIRGADLGAALAGKDRSRTALVVLAAGLQTSDESLPPRERLDAAGIRRGLAASRLFREHGVGWMVLSGAPPAQGEAMRDLVIAEGVPAERIILEDRSLNTRENAAYSTVILREKGIETVVAVTSASHLRRALKDFAAVGVDAIPAAADVVGTWPVTIDSFLPSSWALWRSHVCLHEILGYVRG